MTQLRKQPKRQCKQNRDILKEIYVSSDEWSVITQSNESTMYWSNIDINSSGQWIIDYRTSQDRDSPRDWLCFRSVRFY